jgi:glucokinase
MAVTCAIGFDVGGTKCASGAVVLPEGRILARRLQPTDPERGGEAVLADVILSARSLAEEARQLGYEPASIGVGVAELVSLEGDVLSSAMIPWQGMPVQDKIRAGAEVPAVVEADVRAAAKAEAVLGAGRHYASFLFVTVGTGISASLVVEKTPYAGARGLTGTFASSRGMMPTDDGGLLSGPPLEQFASGPALASRFTAVRRDRTYTGPEVVTLCEAGDELAQSVVGSAGEALGAAVAHLVNVLDPEAVVLGGGLGMVGGVYRKSLESALRTYVWSPRHRDMPVASAELGVEAGFIGAALTAHDRLSPVGK